jgi:hypothetical protein
MNNNVDCSAHFITYVIGREDNLVRQLFISKLIYTFEVCKLS